MSIEERLSVNVENDGDLTLTIAGAPSVTITGADFCQAGDADAFTSLVLGKALKAGLDAFQAGELSDYMSDFAWLLS